MTHIGFTGTKRGMFDSQQDTLRKILSSYQDYDDSVVFHHGDCIGADDQAATAAWTFGYRIVGHPSVIVAKRAYNQYTTEWHPPRQPLLRNHDIVDACSILIAAPGQEKEILRSGTWSTIRYARAQGKRVIQL